jgi:hypothetical protein
MRAFIAQETIFPAQTPDYSFGTVCQCVFQRSCTLVPTRIVDVDNGIARTLDWPRQRYDEGEK